MYATLVRFLVAGALAAALAAPSSAATWGPQVPLSDTVASTEGVQLVKGSDGRVLAVWSYRLGSGVFGVDAMSLRPDGRWGPGARSGRCFPSAAAHPGCPGSATASAASPPSAPTAGSV